MKLEDEASQSRCGGRILGNTGTGQQNEGQVGEVQSYEVAGGKDPPVLQK